MSNNTPWRDTDEPKQQPTPWWDTDESTDVPLFTDSHAPKTDAPTRIDMRNTWARILQWVNQNIHTVIYMTIGLCMAIGILNIGFWRTFLVALCLGGGYLLGSWHDGNPGLMRRLKRFSQRFLDGNPFMNKRN